VKQKEFEYTTPKALVTSPIQKRALTDPEKIRKAPIPQKVANGAMKNLDCPTQFESK